MYNFFLVPFVTHYALFQISRILLIFVFGGFVLWFVLLLFILGVGVLVHLTFLRVQVFQGILLWVCVMYLIVLVCSNLVGKNFRLRQVCLVFNFHPYILYAGIQHMKIFSFLEYQVLFYISTDSAVRAFNTIQIDKWISSYGNVLGYNCVFFLNHISERFMRSNRCYCNITCVQVSDFQKNYILGAFLYVR